MICSFLRIFLISAGPRVQKIDAVKGYLAAVRPLEEHKAPGKGAFARTALPHDAKGLPCFKLEAYAVDRLYDLLSHGKDRPADLVVSPDI